MPRRVIVYFDTSALVKRYLVEEGSPAIESLWNATTRAVASEILYDEMAATYQLLAALATVLLVVPLVSLGGAAARLSARRRDDRLATLRLLGATTATVARMTVLEAATVALIGALAGAAGYLLTGPFVQLIRFRGEPIGTAYWLSPWAVAAVVAAVALLAALSATAGLRQVSISPLGVRRRRDVPRAGWLRAVVGLVIIAVLVVATQGSYAELAVLAHLLRHWRFGELQAALRRERSLTTDLVPLQDAADRIAAGAGA